MSKQIFNPYLPSYEYVPDGEPHIFDERLYIFGSHDQFGGGGYCQNDYVCYSADISDLSEWEYHGVIYKKEQDPNTYTETSLYAPDVAKGLDGRFYLYYSVANSSIISVAVCNTPAGKYEYYGDVCWQNGEKYGTRSEDAFQFDPAVYVDGKKVYLYSGFKPLMGTSMPGVKTTQKMKDPIVVELAEDMLTIISEPKQILERKFSKGLHNFFEASSMRKFGETYYFIYSSNCFHELCYATSNKPDGIFQYQGVLHSNGNVGINGNKRSTYQKGNNHGSLIEINGEYYIFGHRHTNRTGFDRQGIAERITMGKDGKFEQAEYTSSGLNKGPLNGIGCYPSYITCFLQGKKNFKKYLPYITQANGDRESGEDQYITEWKNDGIVGFTYFKFEDTKKIRLRIRGNGKGAIIISDKSNGGVRGHVEVNISEMKKWQDVSGFLNMPSDVSGIYMTYQGEGTLDFLEFEIM